MQKNNAMKQASNFEIIKCQADRILMYYLYWASINPTKNLKFLCSLSFIAGGFWTLIISGIINLLR